ncbi:MAG: Ig-like domain-containing protein [Pseudomonadota bacterium]
MLTPQVVDRSATCGLTRLLVSAALLLVLDTASAFEFKPAAMLGKVSYVTLERGADGKQTSIAVTPDAKHPTAWLAPNYPSTNLCREPGAANERPDCRSYAIYIPVSYRRSTPLPLHLSLHGNGGFAEAQIGDIAKNDGTAAADNAGLEGRYNQLAEEQGFIVVYPNGSINGQGTTVNGRDWNDCRTSEPNSTADDVGFIARVLDDVEQTLNIDRRRVYAHGYSNGAMMTLRLYAERGERFTAFATKAGNQPRDDQTDCALPSAKKSLFMVFGDADTIVPYTGAGVRVSMRSADDTILYWPQFLETEAPTTDDVLWMQNWTAVANLSSSDGAPDSKGYTRLYAGGAEGSEGVGPTQLLVKKIHQGGHSMSGLSQITAAAGQATLGPKNLDVQLADELVVFFQQFAMASGPATVPSGSLDSFNGGRFGDSTGLSLSVLLLSAAVLRRRGVVLALMMLTGLSAQAGQLVLTQSLIAPDGLTRWYHYYQPDNLAANAPVIILLHGGTLSYNKVIDQTRSNAQQQGFGRLDTTQWVDVADAAGALLIIPNGVSPTGDDRSSNDTAGETQSWNDCRNADEASAIATGADDVGFIAQLMDWSRVRFDTDPNRVYVTGHSNGGTMSYRVAAELGHRVAGIAAFIANLPVDPGQECAAPTHPISVFMLHGSADMTMRAEGGCDNTTGPRGCTRSAGATRDFWLAHNKTTGQQARIDYPNRDDRDGAQQGGSTVSSVLHTGGSEGSEGSEVASYVVHGGGHTGPNTKYRLTAASESTGGLQNHDIDAVWQAWEFLKNKTLNGTLPATSPAPRALACKGANASLGPVIDATTTRPATFSWQGAFVQDDGICYLSRQSNAELRGYLFAPADWQLRPDGSLPVVVIGTGSGSAQAIYYIWSARELAAKGYIVLAEDPQGAGRSEANGDPARCTSTGCPGIPFQRADNFVDGFLSSLDFMFGGQHPWLAKADLSRVGLAGHSLSARAASFVGGADLRVDAVVAFDNMSSTLQGDAGVSSGGGNCGAAIGGEPPAEPILVNIRVPTMGEAADRPPGCDATNTNPEIKKTGYEKWRAAGVPSMQLVFADAVHDDWAQTRQSVSQQLESFQYYTRGWFDLYLKGDESARARLLDREVKLSLTTVPVSALYSTGFRSAVFMPEARIDCGDIRLVPCEPAPPPNLPPAISSLPDQIVDEDGSLLMNFSVSDGESPADALSVSVASGNTALLPAGHIILGGRGASRSIRMSPAENQFGSSTVTLTVSDGSTSVSGRFLVSVRAVDDAPTMSAVADQRIEEDSAARSFDFSIADVDTDTGALTLAASSSNSGLVPDANLVLEGSGGSRHLTVTPLADQSGSSMITIRASDVSNSSTETFLLTVDAINDAPTISRVPDQTQEQDQAGAPIALTIADADHSVELLSLEASSSNPTLVPPERIVFGGQAGERSVTITPAAGQSGSSTITLRVSDGSAAASSPFTLTIKAAPAAAPPASAPAPAPAPASPVTSISPAPEAPAAAATVQRRGGGLGLGGLLGLLALLWLRGHCAPRGGGRPGSQTQLIRGVTS